MSLKTAGTPKDSTGLVVSETKYVCLNLYLVYNHDFLSKNYKLLQHRHIAYDEICNWSKFFDSIVFYAISAFFQPYNGVKKSTFIVLESFFQYVRITIRKSTRYTLLVLKGDIITVDEIDETEVSCHSKCGMIRSYQLFAMLA